MPEMRIEKLAQRLWSLHANFYPSLDPPGGTPAPRWEELPDEDDTDEEVSKNYFRKIAAELLREADNIPDERYVGSVHASKQNGPSLAFFVSSQKSGNTLVIRYKDAEGHTWKASAPMRRDT